jgi:hypothetical protein
MGRCTYALHSVKAWFAGCSKGGAPRSSNEASGRQAEAGVRWLHAAGLATFALHAGAVENRVYYRAAQRRWLLESQKRGATRRPVLVTRSMS